MQIERAIVQELVSGRDGQTYAHYERPSEVRETARRLQSWRHGAKEGCVNCGSPASIIRTGKAYCVVCSAKRQARIAPVVSDRGVLPFRERRAEPMEKGITGTFIVFNSESVDLGGFVEVIRPSAVDYTLKRGDIRALWAHDTGQVIGRQSANTLTVEKRRNGLYGVITPPVWAAQYVETVERGDVSNASFGFQVLDDGDVWHISEDKILREIFAMNIPEVSVVAFPAYPATKIGVERLAERGKREVDTRLRMAR